MTTARQDHPIRVLVAKLGLDGHDRGAKVVAHALREQGMEVVYTGLRRTAAEVIATALDEDVDVIGLSILSGAHVALVGQVLAARAAAEMDDVPVVVGGTVSVTDAQRLTDMGVARVFPVRSPIDELGPRIRELTGAGSAR